MQKISSRISSSVQYSRRCAPDMTLVGCNAVRALPAVCKDKLAAAVCKVKLAAACPKACTQRHTLLVCRPGIRSQSVHIACCEVALTVFAGSLHDAPLRWTAPFSSWHTLGDWGRQYSKCICRSVAAVAIYKYNYIHRQIGYITRFKRSKANMFVQTLSYLCIPSGTADH
jgi:hypothetical protein